MEGVSGLNLSHHISNSWLGAGCQWCDAVTLSHIFPCVKPGVLQYPLSFFIIYSFCVLNCHKSG